MVFEQIYLHASCLWRFPRASEWLELLQEVERPPGIAAGLHQYEAPERWMCCNKNSQHWNTVHYCLNALSDYPTLYSFKKKTLSKNYIISKCTAWDFILLYKAVQKLCILAITDVLANHLFVQSRVLSKPLGYLLVVCGVTEEAFLLQELYSLLRLLVKLFCPCY